MSITKLPDICKDLQLVSVYNIDGTSTMELIYKLAIKMNELIREHNEEKTIMAESILEINETLNKLLTEGLRDEVEQVLIEWKQSGELSDIILNSLGEIELKIEALDRRVTKNELDIATLKNPLAIQLPAYPSTQLDTIPNLKVGMIVFDTTRGKCVLYKDSISKWTNLDGTFL